MERQQPPEAYCLHAQPRAIIQELETAEVWRGPDPAVLAAPTWKLEMTRVQVTMLSVRAAPCEDPGLLGLKQVHRPMSSRA